MLTELINVILIIILIIAIYYNILINNKVLLNY